MRFFLLAVLVTVGCSDDSTSQPPKVVVTDQDPDAGTDAERLLRLLRLLRFPHPPHIHTQPALSGSATTADAHTNTHAHHRTPPGAGRQGQARKLRSQT